jgi:L-cysteine/cystine lyase
VIAPDRDQTALISTLHDPSGRLLPALHARAARLAADLAEALAERGVEVAPRGATTLVAWRWPDAGTTRERLAEAGIAIRTLPESDLLRASVGAWNDEADLERLLAAL